MEELLEILNECRPDIDFTTCERLVDDGILDSMDISNIITNIDYVFGFTIPTEKIKPENFNSAKALFALVDRLAQEELDALLAMI